MNVDASPALSLQSATLQSCTYLNLTRFLLAGTDGKSIRVQTADSSLIVLMNGFVFTVMPPSQWERANKWAHLHVLIKAHNEPSMAGIWIHSSGIL